MVYLRTPRLDDIPLGKHACSTPCVHRTFGCTQRKGLSGKWWCTCGRKADCDRTAVRTTSRQRDMGVACPGGSRSTGASRAESTEGARPSGRVPRTCAHKATRPRTVCRKKVPVCRKARAARWRCCHMRRSAAPGSGLGTAGTSPSGKSPRRSVGRKTAVSRTPTSKSAPRGLSAGSRGNKRCCNDDCRIAS